MHERTPFRVLRAVQRCRLRRGSKATRVNTSGSRCAQELVSWVHEHFKQRDLYKDETNSQSVVARPDLPMRSFLSDREGPTGPVPIPGVPVLGTEFNLDATNRLLRSFNQLFLTAWQYSCLEETAPRGRDDENTGGLPSCLYGVRGRDSRAGPEPTIQDWMGHVEKVPELTRHPAELRRAHRPSSEASS